MQYHEKHNFSKISGGLGKNAYLYNRVQENVVYTTYRDQHRRVLGHTNINQTQVYARVTPKKLFEDMDVVPLEEMNQTAEDILHQVALNIHDSNLMKRYVINLAKADREKWQLSEVDKVALVVFPILAYYTGK